MMQSRKKKVLFVVHQLNYGGVQKALLTALNAIDYTQNDVTLYVRKNRVHLLPNLNKQVSKVIINQDTTHYYRKPYVIYLLICKHVGKLFKRTKWSASIQKKLVAYLNKSQMIYEKNHYFCSDEEYDVAISYISGYTAQFVAQYVKAKKKVMFYHASTDENHALHETIMSYFDCIVGVNANVQKKLGEFYPNFLNKMTFVENYVDATEVFEKSRACASCAGSSREGKIILCSCGRLAQVKGFDLAVNTARILKNKQIPFVWYFVGDGPERLKLEQLIKKYGLVNDVIITGMQDNPYPYIAGCDIYVQPSYEEAHPLAIIEALILCRPVVTTATVGGQSLIQQGVNGLIADIDEQSLANAIIRMMKEETLHHKMVEYLQNIDHSDDFEKYKKRWRELLEVNKNEI